MNTKQEVVEIKVPVRFEYLFKIIAQLTLTKKKEILAYLQNLVHKEENKNSDQLINNDGFFKNDLGKYVVENASDSLNMADIRKSLSTIKNSLADEVTYSREER